MTAMHVLDGPALVLINVPTRVYVRYFGAQMTLAAKSAWTLTPLEVEMFRVDPYRFMGIEG
ncbi:hypothetical protein WT25_11110 [Burkholderia territorii]|uniref:hypothetical protein n=1 Tax=Burkholderia territorii TaxID=1503055 RepID=UPI000751DD2B|nr:hypothetical protein [Burkholderia territorii]KVT86295.1 hypothetical protein WT25_11110 [Burkholderia territorii]